MTKKALLKEYEKNLQVVIKSAKESGLKDDQIEQCIRQSFKPLKKTSHDQKNHKIVKCSLLLLLPLSLFIYILLNVHTPTSSLVLRNVQGLTYPALKIVRIISVPIIKLFPSFTSLYDESCLVENPYFYLTDMDCWPCENIHSLLNLTGVDDVNPLEKLREGTPCIIEMNKPTVSLKHFQELYWNYSSELDLDANRLKVTGLNSGTLKAVANLTEENLSSNFHIHWRINKMIPARIVRKLFPKPHFLPERSGQAVERFLFIDGPKSNTYTLPNTECSYVFMIQGSGERIIALKPSNECKDKCKTIYVVMKPAALLLFNWWYWRPVSLPVKNSTSLSFTYMNSFC
ncbi:uncharacterized protein LOC126738633 [Anthonomus grandis grandis]|uniref:uncharacterized protein LOC126738633 n=1 Tax=Anthonomus grandis grandis TaxID=2921223 RepID=UPI002166A907|nr:uncharacterized protein LOC126738633 [Anthonomus grandis grandis]